MVPLRNSVLRVLGWALGGLVVLVVGSAAGGLGGVLGYALLGWVLVRAAPGCAADLRALLGVLAPVIRRRHSLSSTNTGF